MNKIKFTILLTYYSFCTLFAQTSGGPDLYGYSWKNSNDTSADAPVYNWIDITTIGTEITGLADDNVAGTIPIGFDFQYYGKLVSYFCVGSNGYIAFGFGGCVLISSDADGFPPTPTVDGSDNIAAPLMTDLRFDYDFGGAPNPAKAYFYSNGTDTLIISYENVAFWINNVDGWGGSNTFQIILNKTDGSIMFQYKKQQGSWDPAYNSVLYPAVIGIENATGDTGLMVSGNVLPDTLMAIKFYHPGFIFTEISSSVNPTCLGFCDGSATVNVSGGFPPYTIQWDDSSGQTTPTATGLCAGTYTVVVNDSIGSTGSATVVIIDPSPFTVSIVASADSICIGQSTTLTASGGNSYSWNTGATTNTITVSPSTTTDYIVAVTDSNCNVSDSAIITITVNTNPLTPAIIQNENVLASNLLGDYYQWFFNGDTIPGATSYFYIAIMSGSYTVMVIDANGCTSTSTPVNVTISGVNEPELVNDFHIYPNPYSETTLITISNIPIAMNKESLSISIYDLLGSEQKVSYSLHTPNNDTIEIQLQRGSLKNGIYFYMVKIQNILIGSGKLMVEF